MLFPTDDCSDYASKLQDEGFPKATVIMMGPDGKPKLRPDKTIDTRYLRGRKPDGKGGFTGVPDCRFCAIWCMNPRNKIDTSNFTDDEKAGMMNPKVCVRAITHLMQHPQGTHFIQDKSRGRYK